MRSAKIPGSHVSFPYWRTLARSDARLKLPVIIKTSGLYVEHGDANGLRIMLFVYSISWQIFRKPKMTFMIR